MADPKRITAVFIGPDGPRHFPGQGLIEPGGDVTVFEHELETSPEFFRRKPTKKKASKKEAATTDDAGTAGEGDAT